MAYTTVVAGTTITATWGNADVRDQVIVPFTSTTSRDATITSPVVGMVEYLRTNDVAEGLTTRNSANQWRLPWNMPWGVQAVQTFSTSTASGTSGAYADTGATLTFTAVANRRYRYTYSCHRIGCPASAVLQVNPTDAANVAVFNGPVLSTTATAVDTVLTFQWYETGTAASVTRKIRATSSTASAFTFQASSWQTYFTVEDIGPQGAPS